MGNSSSTPPTPATATAPCAPSSSVAFGRACRWCWRSRCRARGRCAMPCRKPRPYRAPRAGAEDLMIIGAMGATGTGGAAGSSAERAERLSDEDLSILALENDTVAGHTCKVIMLEDRIDADALRASIASRLHQAPRLCLRLAEVGGEPSWVPARELDLNAHVVEAGDSKPLDLLEFRHVVAETFRQRL